MSDEFMNFLGIIVIIGFVFVFWNDFKEGKITATSPNSAAQSVLPDQTISSPGTSTYSDGTIRSEQYIPAQ